jgi:hypothetical protein
VNVAQVNMNVNTPHPTCFQKRARLLARFSPRWHKQEQENRENAHGQNPTSNSKSREISLNNIIFF